MIANVKYIGKMINLQSLPLEEDRRVEKSHLDLQGELNFLIPSSHSHKTSMMEPWQTSLTGFHTGFPVTLMAVVFPDGVTENRPPILVWQAYMFCHMIRMNEQYWYGRPSQFIILWCTTLSRHLRVENNAGQASSSVIFITCLVIVRELALNSLICWTTRIFSLADN